MTEQEQVQVTQGWETFCDGSYFDMWCVRRIGDRTFGQGFYVMSQGEAEALRSLLDTRHTSTAEALEAMREARVFLALVAGNVNWMPHPHCSNVEDALRSLAPRLTDAIAKIEGDQP
jgi:hypothetical protein